MKPQEKAMNVTEIFANSALDHAVQALRDQMAQEGAWAILVRVQKQRGESKASVEAVHLVDDLNVEVVAFMTPYATTEVQTSLLSMRAEILKRSHGRVNNPPIFRANDRPPLELVDPQLNPLNSGAWHFPGG